MRTFTGKAGRLGSLESGSRGVYTAFVVFALLHLCSGAMMYWAKTMREAPEGHLAEVGAYYRGDEARMMYAKEFPRLMEITHQHLFSMPLTFLISAHLFFLTGWSLRAKWTFTWLAATSVGGHIAAPWMVRYGGDGWALLYPVSGAVMFLSLGVMLVSTAGAMWLGTKATKQGVDR